MSALLVYKNSRPEVLTWALDFWERTEANQTARYEWMKAIYDAHGVPDDDAVRGAFTRGNEFSGIAWPKDTDLPHGWFRPVKTPQLIKPRSNFTAGRKALTEMRAFNRPDARRELSQQFGMPSMMFIGNSVYTPGVNYLQPDAVWVTWGTRDAIDDLSDVEKYGWQRVSLVEYIAKFGEEAL